MLHLNDPPKWSTLVRFVLALSIVPGLNDWPEVDLIEHLCQHTDTNKKRPAWERALSGHPVVSLYSTLLPRGPCSVPFHFHIVPGRWQNTLWTWTTLLWAMFLYLLESVSTQRKEIPFLDYCLCFWLFFRALEATGITTTKNKAEE